MVDVWDIIKKFKDFCRNQKWKTGESEDWVEGGDGYHNFLLARNVTASTFKRIAANKKCVVREGLSYRVVNSSYTAWVFSKKPSEDLLKIVFEDSELPRRIALYDLSPLLSGKNHCVKLNKTDSSVFREFEAFLKKELKIKVKPLLPSSTVKVNPENPTVAELAS